MIKNNSMTFIKKYFIELFIIFSFQILAISGFASTYTYDSLNRLTSIVYDNGDQLTYFYDASGNRTILKGTTYTVSTNLPSPIPTPGFVVPKGKMTSYPNPCHVGKGAAVTFAFDKNLNDVTIDIYNIAFQRVFRIPSSNIDEAGGTATWNGIGPDGTLVVSNLYFALLRSKTVSTTCKFTLLR